MKPEQIQLIHQSFVRLIPFSELAVRVFRERLFAIEPDLKAIAESSSKEETERLAKALALMIEAFGNPTKMRRYARYLGYRFALAGVGPKFYASGQDALLWTLRHLIPDGQESSFEAWREGLALCAEYMEAGHNELVAGLLG